jgi:4-amino-4-deoxy-L-arabinose transferase-like glycosyltransferase
MCCSKFLFNVSNGEGYKASILAVRRARVGGHVRPFRRIRRRIVEYRATLLEAAVVVLFFTTSIAVSAVGITTRVDLDGYDEGVYWLSLRAMSEGYHLYQEIFYSQPPFFLLSLYPFYASFGATIVSARAGIVAFSLLGLPGAYLMGRALSGRLGALTAVAMLAVTPIYLAQSQILQAEGPGTALLFLAAGTALMSKQLVGRSSALLVIICAVSTALGILIKLLNVTIIPFLAVLLLCDMRRLKDRTSFHCLLSLALGAISAAIATLVVVTPFVGALGPLIHQVITFHLEAEKVTIFAPNRETLRVFFEENAFLVGAAMVGSIVAILRRDWHVVPLAIWLLTTFILLAVHAPLFPHHTIVLVPPLIAIALLGLRYPCIPTTHRHVTWHSCNFLLFVALMVAAFVTFIRADYKHYAWNGRSISPTSVLAADLERITEHGQWIITDAPFAAALANRDAAPWLVDTSWVRVLSANLTNDELLHVAADQRVHAVLFATGRLTALPLVGFHRWVEGHFTLYRTYGDGVELWVR